MLAEILATDGLWLLVVGAVLGGLVRGFSGFGTAMVFLPFAASVYPPVWVLITLCVIDGIGPLPTLPRAWRDGQPRDVGLLCLGALVAMPVGLAILTTLDQQAFRYAIAAVTLALLVLLVAGTRYSRPVGPGLTLGTGGLAGLFGGAFGLPGPPVIFFYMARPLPVAAIRANILMFLFLYDLILVGGIAAYGLFEWQPVLTGLMLVPVYVVALMVGVALFDPARETVYRWVAYAIIAGSVIRGLPIWG